MVFVSPALTVLIYNTPTNLVGYFKNSLSLHKKIVLQR